MPKKNHIKKKILLVVALTIIISLSSASALQIDSSIFEGKNSESELRVVIKMKDGSFNSKEIIKRELEFLSKNTEIESIFEDAPVKASAYDSMSTIQAPDAWKLLAAEKNLTGKGQTACIIDTGIDYNHPDLGGCYGNNNASSECKVLGGYDFINSDEDPLDDNGHGTHVAGIFASKGIFKGIAPDAKIISIKVLDSNGGGYSSDVAKGIEWCINNSEKFNITIIILSLSTDCAISPLSCSESYCPSELFESPINSAYQKNISVLAAAGNMGLQKIPSPACVKNAIPIAASNSLDSIWDKSNINENVKIAAPGEEIHSTIIGGYGTKSGTSMSTPHIAGTIAILNQALSAGNKTKSPKEMEEIIYSSGKKMNYNLLNISISRVNILNALLTIDYLPPTIDNIYPTDRFTTIKSDVNFSCTAKDWQTIKNLSFYLWSNNSEIMIYNYSLNLSNNSESSAEINLKISNLSRGEYFWACSASDEKENYAISEKNQFEIGNISVSLISPEKNVTSNKELNFSCISESVSELQKLTFYLWNYTNLIQNISSDISGIENISSFSHTIDGEGEYIWNCLAENENEKTFAPKNLTISYNASFQEKISESDEKKEEPKKPASSSGRGSSYSNTKQQEKTNQTLNNSIKKINNTQNNTQDIFIAKNEDLQNLNEKNTNSNYFSAPITGAVIDALKKNNGIKVLIFLLVILLTANFVLRAHLSKIRKS